MDTIFSADVSNPLIWYSHPGWTLPDPLCGSQLAIIQDTSIDGYSIYLFGGVLSDESNTSNIYRAGVLDPLAWTPSSVGNLPYPTSYGQFVMINDHGYLYTNIALNKNETRILRCNLSNPIIFSTMQRTLPGVITHSQLGIIYDQIYLFGGNGSSIIFANEVLLKYNYNSPDAAMYGWKTRTWFKSISNKLNLFKAIGISPWRTDYGS